MRLPGDLGRENILPLFAPPAPEPRVVDRAKNRAAGVALEAERKCPHCGAKMVEYRHCLNAGLVKGLLALWMAGGKANVNQDLARLGHNVLANFQKLRYWDLVRSIPDESGKIKRGVWVVTPRGEAFLRQAIKLPRCVRTYRGERVGYEDDQVTVLDVLPGYRTLEDYVRDATPHLERRAS